MASIPSYTTNNFLTTLTRNQAWIGGYKSGSSWRWTDGSAWTYSGWASGQPDNNGPSNVNGGNQDRIQFNFGGVGKWDDVAGTHYNPGLPFICEKKK